MLSSLVCQIASVPLFHCQCWQLFLLLCYCWCSLFSWALFSLPQFFCLCCFPLSSMVMLPFPHSVLPQLPSSCCCSLLLLLSPFKYFFVPPLFLQPFISAWQWFLKTRRIFSIMWLCVANLYSLLSFGPARTSSICQEEGGIITGWTVTEVLLETIARDRGEGLLSFPVEWSCSLGNQFLSCLQLHSPQCQ